MFKSRFANKLDGELAFLIEELPKHRENPEKYNDIVERISKLEKMRPKSSEEGLRPPSWDTVLVVGANIFGILWLARFEKENVIRSPTALKFVMKTR